MSADEIATESDTKRRLTYTVTREQSGVQKSILKQSNYQKPPNGRTFKRKTWSDQPVKPIYGYKRVREDDMKSETRLQASPHLKCRRGTDDIDFTSEHRDEVTDDEKLTASQDTCFSKQEAENSSALDFPVEVVCISQTVPVKRCGPPVKPRTIKQTCSQSARKPHTQRLMPGVAQSRLKLVRSHKKQNKGVTFHIKSETRESTSYNQSWIEKQEKGFTQWLNFILTPSNATHNITDFGQVDLFGSLASMQHSELKPITKKYLMSHLLCRFRRCAFLLYRSEPVRRGLERVDAEIVSGRLSVKKDQQIHADIGIKEDIVQLLMSYDPMWLQIGLETIYDETFGVPGSRTIDTVLTKFLTERLLDNSDIAMSFAHPTVPHSYRPGYEDAMNQYILKQFLYLVLFLDKAKVTRLIDHNPCLFRKTSNVKSSQELLQIFSRQYLSGEGDIIKHLSHMSYNVSHHQTAVDEYDFSVTNLATDLRDGIVLIRLTECLTNDWTLSGQVKLPIVNRLQKLHNVELSMKCLRENKVDIGHISAENIVDGYREKTMELLWRLILQFKVSVLLDEEQLRDEIQYLRRQSLVQSCVKRPSCGDLPELDVYFNSPKLGLLLKWCQIVCQQYGLNVNNFTSSFSDGRALCYIVHHYHSWLIPVDQIQSETTVTHQSLKSSDEDDELLATPVKSWTASFSPTTGKPGNTNYCRQLSNEKANFALLGNAVNELGGVPVMYSPRGTQHTIPDERVMITSLSYLCNRLLELRYEVRAACTIQRRWRQRQMANQRKVNAVLIIQSHWRGFLARRASKRLQQAIVTLQQAFRSYYQRKKEQTHYKAVKRSAILLQAYIRRWLAQRAFTAKKNATVRLQASVRRWLVKRRLLRQHQAAVMIQTTWRAVRIKNAFVLLRTTALFMQRLVRANRLARLHRQHYLFQKIAATKIQSAFKGWQVRKDQDKKHRAATVIQTAWRSHNTCQKFVSLKQAAIMIQTIVRASQLCHRKRQEFVQLRRAAVILQSVFRGMRLRRQLKTATKAATTIQTTWRAHVAKCHYQTVVRIVVKLQKRVRAIQAGCRQRRIFLLQRNAVVRIQSWFRGWMARRELYVLHRASTTIQATWRCHTKRRAFVSLRRAVISMQTLARANHLCHLQRNQFNHLRRLAVTIQSKARGIAVRNHIKSLQRAATTLQTAWRAHSARQSFQALKTAVVAIQKRFKLNQLCYKDRQQFTDMKQAAVLIQSAFRGWRVRKYVDLQCKAATTIQTTWRAYMARKTFLSLKQATVKLQARFRANHLCQVQHHHYMNLRQAAISLQSAIRGWNARKRLKQQTRAAVTIQSTWRVHFARKTFVSMRSITIKLQRTVRANQLCQRMRCEYMELKQATVTIQSAFRGWRVRKSVSLHQKAATTIQTTWRTYMAKKTFLSLKQATVKLQARFRANHLCQVQRCTYMSLRQAAISLQSAVRGCTARKRLKQQAKAADMIQSVWKAYLIRKRFLSTKRAVVSMQRKVIANQLCRALCCQYREQRAAAISIQSMFRGWRARNQLNLQHRVAKTIQTMWRAHLVRKYFLSLKQTAIVLQAKVRANHLCIIQRHQYVCLRHATITLQSAIRGWSSREQLKRMHKAATVIQAKWKAYSAVQAFTLLMKVVVALQNRVRANQLCHKVHYEYVAYKQAVVIIQSAVRRWKVRCCLDAQHAAATFIQATWRGFSSRQMFLALRSHATLIQQRFRANQIFSCQRRLFLHQRRSAVVVQSVFRGWKVRKQLQLQLMAATIIQSQWRAHYSRQFFLSLKKAALIAQARVRSKQKVLRQRHQAATIIQRLWKSHVDQRRFLLLRKSVKTIQQRYRANKLRHDYQQQCLKIRQCVITIQSAFRGAMARHHFNKQQAAAVAIQSTWRKYIARKYFVLLKRTVITMQRLVRARQICHEQQQFVRQHQAAVAIQRLWRGWSVSRQAKAVEAAATTIQAAWRGYVVRQRQKELCQVRQRLQDATVNALPQATLGARTKFALEWLLTTTRMSKIHDGIFELDVSTKHSQECCIKLVEEGGLRVLFGVLARCNRSLPNQIIIAKTCGILLNVAKVSSCTNAVYQQQNAVASILRLLDVHRLNSDMCPTLCQLLTILSSIPECRQEILAQRNRNKITEIFRSLERKVSLEKQRNRQVCEHGRRSVRVHGGGMVTDISLCFDAIMELMKGLGITV